MSRARELANIGTGINSDANALAMTIDSSENVGIGRASSITKQLHIDGGSADAGIVVETSADSAIFFTKGSSSHTWAVGCDTSASNGFSIAYLASAYPSLTTHNLFSITPTGNVGIGIAVPVNLLHLHTAADAATYMRFTNSVTGTSSGDGLQIGIDSDEHCYIWHREANSIIFGTSNTSRMTIASSGKVSIGTTTQSSAPNAMLRMKQQSDSGTYQGIVIENNADDSVLLIGNDGDTWHLHATYGGNGSYQPISFWTGGAKRMLIDNSGNVGIGSDASTPLGKLHVASADSGATVSSNADELVVESSSHGGITILTGTSAVGNIYFADSNHEVNDGFVSYEQSARLLKFGTAAQQRMTIDSSGNVGIGTNSPASFNVQARNLVVGTGSGSQGLTIFSGNSSTGNIFFSDGTSGDDPTRGGINYNHNGNSMSFRVNDAPKMTIDNSGNAKIASRAATDINLLGASPPDMSSWGGYTLSGTTSDSFTTTGAGGVSINLFHNVIGKTYRYHFAGTATSGIIGATVYCGASGAAMGSYPTGTFDVTFDYTHVSGDEGALYLRHAGAGTSTFTTMSIIDLDAAGGLIVGNEIKCDLLCVGGSRIPSNNAGGQNNFVNMVGDTGGEGNAVGIWNEGNNANRYGMMIRCGADDGSGTNYAIGFEDGDGTDQGYVTFTSGTVSYGAFTAIHDAELPDADNENGYPYGTLVDTTEIFYKQKNGTDTERGIQYKTQKTSSAYSKAVLGAYAGKHGVRPAVEEVLYAEGDELPEGKSIGDVKTEGVPAKFENLHQINILGDGHILCNGEKGNITIGDGICTSSTNGEGMKADKMSMIIGIAQEDVTFSGSESKLIVVQYGLRQFTPWTE